MLWTLRTVSNDHDEPFMRRPSASPVAVSFHPSLEIVQPTIHTRAVDVIVAIVVTHRDGVGGACQVDRQQAKGQESAGWSVMQVPIHRVSSHELDVLLAGLKRAGVADTEES